MEKHHLERPESVTDPSCIARAIAANPWRLRWLQTSEPERTRSLPNRHLNLSHENLSVQPPRDLRGRRCLEKQGQSLD